MTRRPAVVFCDFDGTICPADAGYLMLHRFTNGQNDDLIPDWEKGIVSTRERMLSEAKLVRGTADEIYSFLDQFKIDDTFLEFEQICRASGVPLFIVSEGLDFYIRHILSRYDLADLPLFANHGRIEGDRLVVEFPHINHRCSRCGCCKGERIAEYCHKSGDQCRTIFVGDGYSDACAAKEADLLFAKKELIDYCLAHKISYNAFDKFSDVTRYLIEQRLLVAPNKS